MPAFMFEKILPPVQNAPAASMPKVISKNNASRKPRRLIIAMLDRLTLARMRRTGSGDLMPLYLRPPDDK